jgi:hypothetical protein
MAKVVSLLPDFLDQSGGNPDPDPEPQPNGNGGPTTFNAVIVSGAGSPEANGTYTERGEYDGKPYYNLVGEPDEVFTSSIFWDENWTIADITITNLYISSEDVAFPWLVEAWEEANGFLPLPTLTPTNV